jgi:outer membrane protein TolC
VKAKLIFFLLWFSIYLNAQPFEPMVNRAWEHNIMLQAKKFQLDAASSALKEAKSLYGPTVVFGTQYTLASGGRSINFPVGDLLNPVYGTLNQLTQTNAFPQIENVNEQFLPNNFYDARFRITQPIYYPDLANNKKLKAEAIATKELEVKAFKRELSKEVMIAYFSVMTSKKAIAIYESADTLITEAKRTTQSMIKNGIALPSALSRIENQASNNMSQKIDAMANHTNAISYFKFLTGMTKDEVIEEIGLPELPIIIDDKVGLREDIQQINQGIKMQSLAIEKENNFYIPKIGAQLDLGSQDFDFGFEPYALLGINLEVNIFDSKRNSYKKDAIKAEILSLESQKSHVEDLISLKIEIAKENVLSAINQANTYKSRITATDRIYQDVQKKYREGTANYLDLIDAQTQVTHINQQYNIAQNNAWVKWAEYVYATALYPIQ